MIKHVPVYALLMFVFCTSSKGQNKTELRKDTIPSKTKNVFANRGPNKWYSETASKGVIIQNSFPKGGPYTDPTGKKFGHAIFWYRVKNETTTPFELTLHFPADSFPIPLSSDSYLKLFLPPDTMTLDKEGLYGYGATGLISFLDTGLHKPTRLQKILHPKEECLFYIAALSYQSGGTIRAELVLKEGDLFYRIGILPHFDSALFPCGRLVFKK